MRKPHDWQAVQRYYDQGHAPEMCRDKFQISYGAWAMAIRRRKLVLSPDHADNRRRYDWCNVQAYYDEGHSMRACMRHFGFCCGAWDKAVKRGAIRPRSQARPLIHLLANGKARTNIKRRLLRAGLLENCCSQCGLSQWCGEPLVVQIDHVNGIRDDHRLENLRMLCPNCHSQTETYGRRRLQGERQLQETADAV
jgi:hypothetical protein